MPYSTVDDMLIGDMTVGRGSRADKFVTDAQEEMDACLGYRYVLPFDFTEETEIPLYARLYLKRCSNLLASGRFIMANDAGGEDLSVHAYGQSLVTEGKAILDQLCSGAVDIPGAEHADTTVTGQDRGPGISNQDASSAVDSFYGFVLGNNVGVNWAPGTMPL